MTKLYKVAERILKEYDISPPFIRKGVHAYFYPMDFVQMIWNRWGKYEGFYYKIYIFTLRDDYCEVYYLPSALTSLRNHYLGKIKKDKAYLNKHFKAWEQSCKKLEESITVLKGALAHNNFTDLLKAYKDFIEIYLFEYALSAPVQEACGFQPEQWINPEIGDYCKKYKLNVQKISPLLTTPVNLSFVSQEEKELLDLTFKLKSNSPDFYKALEKHQKRWFWVRNNYASIEVLPVSFFEKKIEKSKGLSKSNLTSSIDKLINLPKINRTAKTDLFRKYPPSDTLKLYVKINELFAEMQDKRKAFVLKANHYHKLFLERVSTEFSQKSENLWYYSYQEMLSAIKTNRFISNPEIEKRKENLAVVQSKKEKVVLSGEEAMHFYGKLQEKVTETKSFSGGVASSGCVKGIAKIVLKITDLEKVNEGDIIVSSMTRPEMTVAMKKAAAFVTDEGGITSHAAIIARELKKPCIIGTKIATKVLKDGDLIEVDANNGFVRVLSEG